MKIRNRGWLTRFIQNFSLLAASLLFCLLIFEIALRIFTPPLIFHPNLPLIPYQKMKIKVDLPGVSDTIYHTTNKWGMRGDPIPKDWGERITIITIGGSTTQCYYLSDDKTWPAQLQTLLRQMAPTVMVQNAGLDGHSTRGHLLMMETVIPKIKPDIVILLVGANDLGHSLVEERLLFGNPYERAGLKYYLFTHIKVLQFFYIWQQILINKAPIVDKLQYGNHHGYIAKPITERSTLPDSLESILPSLPEFKNNINAIIDIAKRENIKIIFLTQPTLFDDTQYWDAVQGSSYWLRKQKLSISAATYWKMLRIFNDSLIELCKSRSIDCFDLASRIPHSSEYFYDGHHFNEAGAELAANEVFAFMKNRNII